MLNTSNITIGRRQQNLFAKLIVYACLCGARSSFAVTSEQMIDTLLLASSTYPKCKFDTSSTKMSIQPTPLPQNSSQPEYAIQLNVFLDYDAEITKSEIRSRLVTASGVLNQCGVRIAQIQIFEGTFGETETDLDPCHLVELPKTWRPVFLYSKSRSRHLSEKLTRTGRVSIEPGFAYGLIQINTYPFTMSGKLLALKKYGPMLINRYQSTEAHELAHVLGNINGHNEIDGNLMRHFDGKFSNLGQDLNEDQCGLIRNNLKDNLRDEESLGNKEERP